MQHIVLQTWCLPVRLNVATTQNSVISKHTPVLALKSDNKIITVILTKQSLSKTTQPDFNARCSRVLQFRQGFEYNGSASTKKNVACFIECRIKDTPFCYELLEISSPLLRRISPSPHYNLHIIIAGTGKEYRRNKVAANSRL